MVKLFLFEIYFVLKKEKKYPCEKVLKTAPKCFFLKNSMNLEEKCYILLKILPLFQSVNSDKGTYQMKHLSRPL